MLPFAACIGRVLGVRPSMQLAWLFDRLQKVYISDASPEELTS
jgi:hypothetical protein